MKIGGEVSWQTARDAEEKEIREGGRQRIPQEKESPSLPAKRRRIEGYLLPRSDTVEGNLRLETAIPPTKNFLLKSNRLSSWFR